MHFVLLIANIFQNKQKQSQKKKKMSKCQVRVNEANLVFTEAALIKYSSLIWQKSERCIYQLKSTWNSFLIMCFWTIKFTRV